MYDVLLLFWGRYWICNAIEVFGIATGGTVTQHVYHGVLSIGSFEVFVVVRISTSFTFTDGYGNVFLYPGFVLI
jgi:hypothetical protein